jgi:ubiquinol-cytochrome c reductase cytochrome b subunit
MKKLIHAAQGVFQWVDDRLHLTKLYESTAGHHVPQSASSWFYVFGSATLLCFLIQIATGIMLAMVYVPSAAVGGVIGDVVRHDNDRFGFRGRFD